MTIPAEQLDAIKRATRLSSLVQGEVRLKRNGAGRWSGCCPFHPDKSPSFSVVDDKGFYHCFGCGAHGSALDWLMQRRGLSFMEAVETLAADAGIALPSRRERPAPVPPALRPKPVAPLADAEPDDGDRIEAARRIWIGASDIALDGPIAAYLRRRHIWPLPPAARQVLRQARLEHPHMRSRHWAMVARVDAPDGTPCAVHRIFLTDDGRKLPVEHPKLAKGRLKASTIRLAPVGPEIGVAEGIETALAAAQLSGIGVWACISATVLEQFSPPFDVGRVVIFADRDQPKPRSPEGRGLQAARTLQERLRPLHVETEIRMPHAPFGDYADVLAAIREQEAAR
ncbi:hypothetical protein EOD42_02970 [Rhodovarius crocodyli]|uniref:Zinc finger CHC2-type domain-containing protein n=1 Tax=Rhodovarius crocodyli TaxID=1979269 RepID=A0A437MN59_9PROT|nr:CHC2 zinc finger domain-containing protein [Rhodovarius crocodyli]RVT99084.1 hypothetical protein EOD42_02970 [Rhodovarius crocodyli]